MSEIDGNQQAADTAMPAAPDVSTADSEQPAEPTTTQASKTSRAAKAQARSERKAKAEAIAKAKATNNALTKPKPANRNNGRFMKGYSGNPGGSVDGYRKRVNASFLKELSEDFEENGRSAIVRARQENPLGYCKILTLLVPKEIKTETTSSIKALSDEQLEQAIASIKAVLDANMIDVTPRPGD